MAAAEEEAEEAEEDEEDEEAEEAEEEKGPAIVTSPRNPRPRLQISSPPSYNCKVFCSATSIQLAGEPHTAGSRPQRSDHMGAIVKSPTPI